MAKHTVGFPLAHPRDSAIADAVAALRTAERPLLGADEPHSAEIVDTARHRANGEYVVVVRTPEPVKPPRALRPKPQR